MIEDLMPFLLMVAGMAIFGIIWAVQTVRQAFDKTNNHGYGYGSFTQAADERPSAETSAGRGGGLQG